MDIQLLQQFLTSNNIPAYRQRQILSHYYTSRFKSFRDMSDLPKDLREKLTSQISYLSVEEVSKLSSVDSNKALLKLADGSHIETVLMDYGDWKTACISSQVGCALGCSFCATGKMGFKRDLTSEEIIDQIIYWNQQLYPQNINRVVFMGMGEPFLNWSNVISAIRIINSPKGLGIGARKISVSTAGIPQGIRDFADENSEINLAISLHSAVQSTREKLMPIARKYSLEVLYDSINYYHKKTNRQVFLEYALIDRVNDDELHLQVLVDLLKSNRLLFLNLISLNPIKGGLTPSTNLKFFKDRLDRLKINYTHRQPIGRSINSACGQLIFESANK